MDWCDPWQVHSSLQSFIYSFIASDITAAMLVERTIAKKSFGNLTLLLCKTWATFFHCFGTNMAFLPCACNARKTHTSNTRCFSLKANQDCKYPNRFLADIVPIAYPFSSAWSSFAFSLRSSNISKIESLTRKKKHQHRKLCTRNQPK